MAKPVVLAFRGADVSFAPSKVDRSRLYGQRRRVAVDAEGRICSRASLTLDGTTLISSGMTSQGYFTPQGRWVPRGELVGLGPDGQPVDLKPSTLGVAQAVHGPVDSTDVLALSLQTVFQLTPEEPDSGLVQALRAGEIYSFPFKYAAGFETEVAYLVANDEGIFALVGAPVALPWSEEGAIFVPESQPDDDAADLDFDEL